MRIVIMTRKHGLILLACAVAFCALFLLVTIEISCAEPTYLHINLKAGDILHPETKGDPDASPEMIHVEAEYTEDIFGNRGNRDWVEVGTWSAQDRETDFEWDGQVRFNVWYQIIDEGYDADPQFSFGLQIAGNFYYEEVAAVDPGTNDVIELAFSRNFASDTLATDDEITLHIEYEAWEDCNFYFDNASYDAGLQLHADFLHLFDMSAEGEEVQLEVYDSFGSDWDEVKTYFELDMDGEPVGVNDITTGPGETRTVYGEEVTSTIITWTLDETLDGGEELEAWVKYTWAEDMEGKGYTKTVSATSGEKKRPDAVIKEIRPSPADEGQEVSFDASDSSDEDGTIETYVWKSDKDGEFYNGSDALVKYSGLSAGSHTITLGVQDNDGMWSSEETSPLTINPNALPEVELESPGDGETITTTFVSLEWAGHDEDGDDLSYDVYLDTDDDPGTMVAEGLTDEEYDVEELEEGETYYWKVVVSDGKAETESDIWSLTIEALPDNTAPEVQLLSPANGSQLTATTVTLEWEGNDDDLDPLSYDIYLDTKADPETKVATGESDESYSTTLKEGESYYWRVVVSDGEEEVSSGVWSFTVEKKDDGDDDDDDFEIAGVNGYVVVGSSVGVAAVMGVIAVFLVIR